MAVDMLKIIIYSFLLVHIITIDSYFNSHEYPEDEEHFYIDETQFSHHRVRRNELTNVGKKISDIGHESGTTVEVGNENDNSFVNTTAANDENFWKTKNISMPYQDSHRYYNSTYYQNGKKFFIDISKSNTLEANHLVIREHQKLSKSYKKAFKIPLNFSFPFYGSMVNEIVVTTGGFINISPYFHSFVHLVHYVAPLMANFNPNKSDDTKVFVAFGNDIAIIQWNKMLLNHSEDVNQVFTFQIQLFKNGTIILAYKDIPLQLKSIKKTGPLNVTVGIADGFILRYRHYDLRKKRIIFHNYVYSYHKVNFEKDKVVSNAAFKLDMLESCVQFKNCTSCTAAKKYFKCDWCSKINLCSDTLDWHRQKWVANNCKRDAITSQAQCAASVSTDIGNKISNTGNEKFRKKKDEDMVEDNSGKVIGGIVGGLFLVIIIAIGIFFLYAYFHPQSKVGMWLIEHRPSRVFTTNFDKVPEEELL